MSSSYSKNNSAWGHTFPCIFIFYQCEKIRINLEVGNRHSDIFELGIQAGIREGCLSRTTVNVKVWHGETHWTVVGIT